MHVASGRCTSGKVDSDVDPDSSDCGLGRSGSSLSDSTDAGFRLRGFVVEDSARDLFTPLLPEFSASSSFVGSPRDGEDAPRRSIPLSPLQKTAEPTSTVGDLVSLDTVFH